MQSYEDEDDDDEEEEPRMWTRIRSLLLCLYALLRIMPHSKLSDLTKPAVSPASALLFLSLILCIRPIAGLIPTVSKRSHIGERMTGNDTNQTKM